MIWPQIEESGLNVYANIQDSGKIVQIYRYARTFDVICNIQVQEAGDIGQMKCALDWSKLKYTFRREAALVLILNTLKMLRFHTNH